MTLTPLGTARVTFLAAMDEPEVAAEPPNIASDAEEPEHAYLGWEIARCMRGANRDEWAGVAALAAACIATMRAGSTRMPLEQPGLSSALSLAGTAGYLPAVLGVIARARLGRQDDPIMGVMGRPGERKPLVIDGPWLYTERMRVLEERFAVRVRERMRAVAVGRDARTLSRAIAAIAAGPPPLTGEQKNAIKRALVEPLALVSGGPGTGKTSIVVALLRALVWLGERLDSVAIAAPTGKAAQRLRESLHAGFDAAPKDLGDFGLRDLIPAPQTIHRLLGWSPRTGRFARHENDPLTQRTIVIDEASMIDLLTLDRLLRAAPAESRVLLLGDADQLPSVEAGAAFRDLCAALGASRLTVNLRVAQEPNARRIVALAHDVNRGSLGAEFERALVRRRAVDEIAFEGAEHLATSWTSVGDAVLDAWWARRFACVPRFRERIFQVFRAASATASGRASPGGMVSLDPEHTEELVALFGAYVTGCILCVTRTVGGLTSAEGVNRQMLTFLPGAPPSRRWRVGQATPGSPLVAGRNDYERQLFNGDHALVLRVDPRDGQGCRPMAVFQRGGTFEAVGLEAMADADLGFALTVHRAQGSEFDDVLLVFPDSDLPLATRELVYTAVTRARRSALIVGSEELLARAVDRVGARYSGIAEKLAANAPLR